MSTALDPSIDHHVHTFLCRHAQGTPEDYVKAALDRGLRKLVFLEHLEIGVSYPARYWLEDDELAFYFAEIGRLRSRYGSAVEIVAGLEVGVNVERLDDLAAALGRWPHEYVGVSLHYLRSAEGHDLNVMSTLPENADRLARVGWPALIGRYYDELRRGVEALEADMLCHLDAVCKNVPDYPYDGELVEKVDALLGAAAARGMKMEINTSGFTHIGRPFPADWITARAGALGIPLVLSSDAHRPGDVGRHFDRVR